MSTARGLSLAVLPFLVGCSFHDDLVTICNAEELSGASRATEDRKAMLTADYLVAHVRTAKAKKLFAELARTSSAREQSEALRRAAGAEGVSPCPFADAMAARAAAER
jgi:hypothetical protein